jgi:hypothetical protein
MLTKSSDGIAAYYKTNKSATLGDWFAIAVICKLGDLASLSQAARHSTLIPQFVRDQQGCHHQELVITRLPELLHQPVDMTLHMLRQLCEPLFLALTAFQTIGPAI